MQIPDSTQELFSLLDERYKKISDCDRDMDAVNQQAVKMLVDVELIKQQMRIIKWIACATLTAAIGALVMAFFNLILK
jgi:hypothetical protein